MVRWGPWAAQHGLRHPLFFAMTGIHAFHVISGLIALAVIYGMVRNGRFGKGNYLGVKGRSNTGTSWTWPGCSSTRFFTWSTRWRQAPPCSTRGGVWGKEGPGSQSARCPRPR